MYATGSDYEIIYKSLVETSAKTIINKSFKWYEIDNNDFFLFHVSFTFHVLFYGPEIGYTILVFLSIFPVTLKIVVGKFRKPIFSVQNVIKSL